MPPGSEDDHDSDFACADWLTGLDTTNPCVDDAMNVSSQIRSASIFSDASLLVDSSGTVKNATVFCGAGSSDRGTISCMFAGQWRNWEMLAKEVFIMDRKTYLYSTSNFWCTGRIER